MAVCLLKMVFIRCASSELQFGALRGVVGTRVAGDTGEASRVGRSSALSGEYAPYSAREGGRLIVDKPEEC